MNFLRTNVYEIIFTFAVLCVYVFFSAPGLTWGDGVHIALSIRGSDVPHEFRGDHPVHRAAATAFAAIYPAGDLIRRLNLFSAFAAAGAIAVFLALLHELGISRGAALAGAAMLAFSHLFWFHAELAEVYSLFAVFFFAVCNFLLRYIRTRTERELQLLLLVSGLACGSHPLIILAYPGIAVLIFSNRPAARLGAAGVARCLFAFLMGLSPVIYIFAQGAAAAGIRQGFLNAFFLGRGELANEVFRLDFISSPLHLCRNLLLFTLAWCYQFIGLGLILPAIGAPLLWRRNRDFAVFALITAVLNFIFAIDYNVSDQPVFYLPIFLLSAVCGALGAEKISARFSRSRFAESAVIVFLIIFPVSIYPFAPGIYRGLGMNLASFHAKPLRDPLWYFLVPAKRDCNEVEKYVNVVFSELPHGAAVFMDKPEFLFLQYSQRLRKIRCDLIVRHLAVSGEITEADAERLSTTFLARPTYVGSAYADILGRYFMLDAIGLTARVAGRKLAPWR